MCGACGILAGTPDWGEGAGKREGAARLAERHKRVRLVYSLIQPAGVRLRDFGGRLVLQSSTGRTRIVSDLAHVWKAADEIGRRPIDPLGFKAGGAP